LSAKGTPWGWGSTGVGGKMESVLGKRTKVCYIYIYKASIQNTPNTVFKGEGRRRVFKEI
jgi:hypothetical protein